MSLNFKKMNLKYFLILLNGDNSQRQKNFNIT